MSEEMSDVVKTLGQVVEKVASDPQRLVMAQTALTKGFLDLWANNLKKMQGEAVTPVVEPEPTDKRFRDPEWNDNPVFDFVKQAYLLTTKWADDLVQQADDIDPHTKHKAQFYVKQLSSALAPTNFVATNPELLRTTLEQNGENLVRGMKMMVEDIKAGKGTLKLRQTEPGDFKVGVNLANEGDGSLTGVIRGYGTIAFNPLAGEATFSNTATSEGNYITKWVTITDILGEEDHFGDMDFKLAGTTKGITGFQLDLKINGLPFEIAKTAIMQARDARIEILKVMLGSLPAPRADLSKFAPRIQTIQIDPEKIGLLIGPGGKTIRSIIEQTKATIDIEDDGTVVRRADPAHKVVRPTPNRYDELLACWREITAQVLFIEGTHSRLAADAKRNPEVYQERLAAFQNVVDVERIEDAGHNIHHDQPEVLARVIEKFLLI